MKISAFKLFSPCPKKKSLIAGGTVPKCKYIVMVSIQSGPTRKKGSILMYMIQT